ncbi:MAG: glycosyltransferase family 2 protein [Anaerolineae bacterium]|nr:MAG: glycosyltransferase family 2 protein [Anaerolineae bacterium]
MVEKESGPGGNGRSRPKIVALIPAYNEERFIGSVVLQAHRFADTVVVVDDGSTDATGEIAGAAGALVVRHEQNQGKGQALNTGFRTAREWNLDVIVTLDGDGQHVPEEMALVAAPVLEGRADIVVGSRYLDKRSMVPRHRIWGHRFFNLLINHGSRVSLTDSQSGFRAFSPLALSAISFGSNGFSVESEMQFLADQLDLRMAEVPITVHYQDGPKRSVIAHGLNVLNGVMRLVGQYRPLLFFGLTGMFLLLVGVAWGGWVVEVFHRKQALPVGSAMISVLVSIIGSLVLFSGVILHSVRKLLVSLTQPGQGEVHRVPGWSGMSQFVNQYRSLLLLSLPGTLSLFFGVGWGIRVVDIFRRTQALAVGSALICMLLSVVGSLALLAGVILHSVRGLILGLALVHQ